MAKDGAIFWFQKKTQNSKVGKNLGPVKAGTIQDHIGDLYGPQVPVHTPLGEQIYGPLGRIQVVSIDFFCSHFIRFRTMEYVTKCFSFLQKTKVLELENATLLQ